MICMTTLRILPLQKVPENTAFVSLIALCFVLSQPFSSAYTGSWCPCTHAFGRQGLSIDDSHSLHLYVPLAVCSAPTPLKFDADGEHDWMDPVGGINSIDNLKAAGNERARMYIVPRAGHHGKSFTLSLTLQAW